MQKNPVPYYTLKQASKLLNEKFKTNIYDVKTVLRMAIYYHIQLHVLFSGNWDIKCDCFVPIDIDSRTEKDKSKENYRKIVLDIETIIESSIGDSALLRMNDMALRYINSYGEFRVDPDYDQRGIDGFLRWEDLFNNKKSNPIAKIFENYFKGSVSTLNQKQIESIAILAIYPSFGDKPEYYDYLSPNVKPYYSSNNEEPEGYYPIIKRKDLLITHIEFEKIINSELKTLGTPENDTRGIEDSISYVATNRGVSKAKNNAKLAAKTLAQYLWKDDVDHNIKLLEMARKVHTELQDTEHRSQLPSVESVKEWLKPIAPVYARISGRPQLKDD